MEVSATLKIEGKVSILELMASATAKIHLKEATKKKSIKFDYTGDVAGPKQMSIEAVE